MCTDYCVRAVSSVYFKGCVGYYRVLCPRPLRSYGGLGKDLSFLDLSFFICKTGVKYLTGFVLKIKSQHV